MTLDDDALRQLFPEQMQRDPSGDLARLTGQVLEASTQIARPEIRYVCIHGQHRRTVAMTGWVGEHGLFVATKDGYRAGALRGDLLRVELDDGTYVYSEAPGGARPVGRGVRFPDGYVALVFEPPSFAVGPPGLPYKCQSCGEGTLQRHRLVEDLRAVRPGQARTITI